MFIKPRNYFLRLLPTGFGKEFLRGAEPDPSAPSINSVGITPATGPVGTVFTATASVSGWPAPARAWQWKLDGVDIEGATGSSYESEAAGELTVRLTATNSEGSDFADSSSVEVTEVAPVITAAGTISGGAKIGVEQTVSGFSYTGEDVTITYSWLANGVERGTSAAYTTGVYDGQNLVRRTTVTNSGGSVFADTPAVAITYNAPTWGTIDAQEWTLDSGVQTLNLSPYLTVTGASISDVSVTVQLLDAADAVFSDGVFEDGVFEGGAGSPSHISVAYTGGAWLLSIDTDETGPLDGATVELRASNSGGSADTSFAATVAEGAPAENFSLTLNGSDELVFEGVASSLVLNVSDELEIDYA